MKVLLLSEFFPFSDGGKITGGCEARTYYLAKELVKAGHAVTVLAANLPGTKKEDSWGKMRVVRAGPRYDYIQSGSNLSRFLFALSLIIKGCKIDFEVIDANNTAVYVASFLIARLKRKKLVFWVPDILGFRGWIKALGFVNGAMNYINEWLSFSLPADHYIALSDMTKKKLEDENVEPSKISVIYPGIEVIDRKPETGFPKGLISVHRLVGYKQTDTVIRAIALLKKRGVSLTYKIVGEGPQKKSLVDLAEKMGLKNQIKFLGNIPHAEVLKLMSRSHIFCLPSSIEGFGIVTLEAAGCGLPFVNSNIPVHQELADKSRAGLIFNTGDFVDLADKIHRLIKEPLVYHKLCVNAMEFARLHTLKAACGETLKIYRSSFEFGA